MYKEHLLHNIEREIILLKRLAEIIEEKDLKFSPGEKVRTTHELMQYLSSIGANMMSWMLDPNFGAEQRKAIREENMTVSIADFSHRLDNQLKKIKESMSSISEEQLLNHEIEMPWKEKMPLGAGIINAPIKFLTNYRMQLFLNLKLNGRPNLGTKEAWVL
jgi:hypothetical protein